MAWYIVIGVTGRIVVIKISPGRLLLVNSCSGSVRSLRREPYAETLIPIHNCGLDIYKLIANGPMVVLNPLLHFAI